MRIITGSARGCKLYTLEGNNTRPTSERAKEAVFSILQFSVQGAGVLDLYSGSGQMALEALSRGAESATLIDNSQDAVNILKKNAQKTHLSEKCRIIRGDVCGTIPGLRGVFSLVFIDPPYAAGLLPPTLRALAANKCLDDGALIVCESASHADVFGGDTALQSEFEVRKTAGYGIACFTILAYVKKSDGQEAHS